MPTPLEILLDPVSLGVLALYGALMLLEALAPGKQLPKIRGWIPRALASFVAYFYLSSYLPLLWDSALAQYQLFNLESMNVAAATVIAVLVFELGVYVWHRAMHETNWLWRSFHQMHHSAERLDTYGAFYFSPLDMIGFTFVGSLSLSLIVGIPDIPAHQREDTPVARLPRAAAGKSQRASQPRCPSLELFGSAVVRHPVRHLSESKRLRRGNGFLRWRLGTDRRHATVARCFRGARSSMRERYAAHRMRINEANAQQGKNHFLER